MLYLALSFLATVNALPQLYACNGDTWRSGTFIADAMLDGATMQGDDGNNCLIQTPVPTDATGINFQVTVTATPPRAILLMATAGALGGPGVVISPNSIGDTCAYNAPANGSPRTASQTFQYTAPNAIDEQAFYAVCGSQAGSSAAPPTFLRNNAGTGGGGGGGDDDGDDVCFSGSTELTLESGETKAIKDVVLGDSIQVTSYDGSLTHAKVVFLPHKTNKDKGTFVELMTAAGRRIQLTKKHFILASEKCNGDYELFHAENVEKDMCLSSVDGEDKVIQVGFVQGEGMYTVVTDHTHGLVVANGLKASSFAINHGIVNTWYHIHRAAYHVVPSWVMNSDLIVKSNHYLGSVAAAIYSLGY